MKQYIPYEMLALTLKTQSYSDSQILCDRFDKIIDDYLLKMRSHILSKELANFCDENESLKAKGLNYFVTDVLNMCYQLEIAHRQYKLKGVSIDVTEHVNACLYWLARIAIELQKVVDVLNMDIITKFHS